MKCVVQYDSFKGESVHIFTEGYTQSDANLS